MMTHNSLKYCDKIMIFSFQEPMPATTGEPSEPQHIEDAYSGKLDFCFLFRCIYKYSFIIVNYVEMLHLIISVALNC